MTASFRCSSASAIRPLLRKRGGYLCAWRNTPAIFPLLYNRGIFRTVCFIDFSRKVTNYFSIPILLGEGEPLTASTVDSDGRQTGRPFAGLYSLQAPIGAEIT
jgi:hypothetical protein